MKYLWIASVAVCFGCKGGVAAHVTDVPDATPPGWTKATSEDGVVRIGVPSGWRYGVDRLDTTTGVQIPEGDSELARSMQQLQADTQKNEDEREQSMLREMAKKGIVLNVICLGARPIPGEARTRFYVKKTPGVSSLEAAAEKEREHFAHKPRYDTVKLPIGEALRTRVVDELRDGGVLTQISYVVVDGDDMYSLRFKTEENASVIDQIAEQVAQTWRIKPAKAAG